MEVMFSVLSGWYHLGRFQSSQWEFSATYSPPNIITWSPRYRKKKDELLRMGMGIYIYMHSPSNLLMTSMSKSPSSRWDRASLTASHSRSERLIIMNVVARTSFPNQ